jgi:excisionase family DNA binding protein
MDDLLTTKQLQELLQIDRVTVYRMLKDGRLDGVKIGNQWRFPRQEVEALLSGGTSSEVTSSVPETPPFSTEVIPLNCIQAMQDVFADMAGVGAVTTDADGQPLTELSNCSRFCRLIQSSKSGYEGCIASWRKLADQTQRTPTFVNCHTGLQYARAGIEVNGRLEGMLVAGQFYAEPASPAEEQARLKELADKYDLELEALAKAAQEISVLDDHQRAWIGVWLEKVAHTFEQVGRERADLMNRLRHIAEMSRIEPA